MLPVGDSISVVRIKSYSTSQTKTELFPINLLIFECLINKIKNTSKFFNLDLQIQKPNT
jgi:hypothetical protein